LPSSYTYVDSTRIAKDRDALLTVMAYAREIRRRIEHPYYNFAPDDHPLRNQEGFFRSTAMTRLVFGGSQSGKSRSIAQEIAWWLCEDHPYQETPAAPRIYLVSASYRTIQEGVWRHLEDIIPSWEIERRGPNITNTAIPQYVLMKKGGQIDFISGQGFEEARRKLQAAAIHLAVIDEEVDQILYEELLRRRLAYGGRVVVGATLIRSEPWCMDLEDRAETGDPECELFRFSTYRARDCGHVQASVVKEIETQLSKEEVEVTLHGKSRRGEGLVYTEFSREHMVQPFAIPDSWTRYCAIDPGVKTFAALWCAVSPDETFYVYRELYEHSSKWKEVADLVARAEGQEKRVVIEPVVVDDQRIENREVEKWFVTPRSERIQARYIDPSSRSRTSAGGSGVCDLFAGYGLFCSFADNQLEAGIQRVKGTMLKGLSGRPQLQIFVTCKNLIDELRKLRWIKSKNPNAPRKREIPHKQNDHAADTLRYLCATGMRYVPHDRLEGFIREQELQIEDVKMTDGIESRRYRHLMKRYMKDRNLTEPTPHIGGLGTEY
jgi:hypothetical protein